MYDKTLDDIPFLLLTILVQMLLIEAGQCFVLSNDNIRIFDLELYTSFPIVIFPVILKESGKKESEIVTSVESRLCIGSVAELM